MNIPTNILKKEKKVMSKDQKEKKKLTYSTKQVLCITTCT